MVPAVRVAQPAPRRPLLHDAGAASRGVISASAFLAQCAILTTPRLLQGSAVVCVCVRWWAYGCLISAIMLVRDPHARHHFTPVPTQ